MISCGKGFDVDFDFSPCLRTSVVRFVLVAAPSHCGKILTLILSVVGVGLLRAEFCAEQRPRIGPVAEYAAHDPGCPGAGA